MMSSTGIFRAMKYAKVCVFGILDSAATRTASSGKNVKDLLHVSIGGGCCLLWIAAALTRAQIGRVPVPPVMLGVHLLEVTVVLCRLAEEPCQGCNVHGLWSRQVPLAAWKPRHN
jgi:hypothetical protein